MSPMKVAMFIWVVCAWFYLGIWFAISDEHKRQMEWVELCVKAQGGTYLECHKQVKENYHGWIN